LCRADNRTALSLIVGNDAMYADGYRLGADGLVSGIAAMAPELILSLQQALTAGRPVSAHQFLLQECISWLDRYPVPVAIKLACGFRGLNTGELAVPLSPAQQELIVPYREWFGDWMARVRLLG
jgi:dihydrodipicolinate synthase/N-acetylneuraminate lyase